VKLFSCRKSGVSARSAGTAALFKGGHGRKSLPNVNQFTPKARLQDYMI
jgi:hypothetical protein